nr:hypothetical protein CFP56_69881 [Quercus suber]
MAGKRRRERDRPKASHDASYNPNKRVLLSYGSEEEQVEDEALEQLPQGHPQAETDLANYTFDQYDDCDEEDRSSIERTETRQQTQQKDDSARKAGNLKRERKDKRSRRSQPLLRNEATGQWPALGFQWENEDEGEDYGDDGLYTGSNDEAMAYLRAVRSERQSMPEVFTSVAREEDEDIYWERVDDSRGFFDDGAYVGRPSVSSNSSDPLVNPQNAFTAVLKKRFLALRQQLQRAASLDEVALHSRDRPTQFHAGSNISYAEWLRALGASTPVVPQMKVLSQESVFGLLVLIRKHFVAQGKHISVKTGAWIWSLLARLNEMGNMSSDQVWQVRELGKDALLVQISFYDAALAAKFKGIDTDQEDRETSEYQRDVGSQTAKSTESAADSAKSELDVDEIDDNSAKGTSAIDTDLSERQHTLATLEMILAIVGDVFGQRDLLEARRSWNADGVVETAEETGTWCCKSCRSCSRPGSRRLEFDKISLTLSKEVQRRPALPEVGLDYVKMTSSCTIVTTCIGVVPSSYSGVDQECECGWACSE